MKTKPDNLMPVVDCLNGRWCVVLATYETTHQERLESHEGIRVIPYDSEQQAREFASYWEMSN